jgi:hypothetical protein
VCPVKYELGFYIPEDDILHSHRRENFKSYEHYQVSGSKFRSLNQVPHMDMGSFLAVVSFQF